MRAGSPTRIAIAHFGCRISIRTCAETPSIFPALQASAAPPEDQFATRGRSRRGLLAAVSGRVPQDGPRYRQRNRPGSIRERPHRARSARSHPQPSHLRQRSPSPVPAGQATRRLLRWSGTHRLKYVTSRSPWTVDFPGSCGESVHQGVACVLEECAEHHVHQLVLEFEIQFQRYPAALILDFAESPSA